MLHIFNLLIFPFIADVVIQIAALYSSNNSSAHPVAYPQPPRIFAVLLYAYNNKIMTLTLIPYIADVQIAALYASNPSAHLPWRISPASYSLYYYNTHAIHRRCCHPNRCITCVQSFNSSALTHIPSLLASNSLYYYMYYMRTTIK